LLTANRLNLLASIWTLPRDLRLLFLSLFLWTFGLGLYNYIWPLYLKDLNATPSDVGLVFSIGFLAVALTMIPGAILANKYELKAILIIGWAMGIPPPLMYYFARSWFDVIPGVILLQVSAFNLPAFYAYIAGASDRAKIATNFGITWASFPLGLVFSPIVGSVLLDLISLRQIFLLTFVFFTVSTIILFFMKSQPPLRKNPQTPKLEFPRSRREGMLLLYLVGAALAFSITIPFIPLYFQDAVGLRPSIIQLLGAIQSLGATVFGILLGRRADSRGKGGAIALGLTASATGLFGVLLVRNLFLAFPIVFLVGGARAPSPVVYSMLSTGRQDASRAGQYGFYLTLENLGFVAGSYLGGVLYSLDPTIVFCTTSASFLALATLAAFSFRGRASRATPSELGPKSANPGPTQDSKSF
jgi:MFS family permease